MLARRHAISCVVVLFLAVVFGAPAQAGPTGGKPSGTSPDGIWQPAASGDLASASEIRANRQRLYHVDVPALAVALAAAPLEGTEAALKAPVLLTIPDPDGAFLRFQVVESPVMAPELARKYPEIRTFLGRGLDDPGATVRFDLTPRGFHALVQSPRGMFYVDPARRGQTDLVSSYYKRDYVGTGGAFECHTPAAEKTDVTKGSISSPSTGALSPGAAAFSSGGTLSKYRLAVGATLGYTAYHSQPSPPNKPAGLAAIVTAINRINGIFETEVAIRLELIANNDDIVMTNATDDPWKQTNVCDMAWANTNILRRLIGANNYDIGHVFSALGPSGCAYLGACLTGKGRGATGSPVPDGDPFWVDYVAHEMGHQFDALHTFNADTGACFDNQSFSARFEPGSGSTLMGYAGLDSLGEPLCAPNDLQDHSDPYFLFQSYDEIRAYVAGAGDCDVAVSTGNSVPTVNAGPDVTIPKLTAFVLTPASASDPDNDPLTYCWEQADIGPVGNVDDPDNGESPIFRSFPPTTDPSRTIPKLESILSGTLIFGERYPSAARIADFVVTVRDNRAGGGGVASDARVVTIDAAKGPFTVTAPNTSVTWTGTQTITWDVNLTSALAANVKILLSTDGGFTYPVVLAASTPNDGTESVSIPGPPTVPYSTTARVRVEAVGNIFFDISDMNFTVNPDCPSVSPCPGLTNDCTRGHETGATNAGINQCFQWDGTLLNCGSQSVYVITTTCRRAACCLTVPPTCLCPISCGGGSYLECR
jgi:hypothetical protein